MDNPEKSVPLNTPEPLPRGSRRGKLIKTFTAIALVIYVPIFLISLLSPQLVASGMKHVLIKEVEHRFEKEGGLAKRVTSQAIALGEKFKFLEEKQQKYMDEVKQLNGWLTANAEAIITSVIDTRNDEESETTSTMETTSDSPGEKSGKWKSRLKQTIKSKTIRSDSDQTTSSLSFIGAVLLKGIAKPGGLLENIANDKGLILSRLKSAIIEKYDKTLRELIKEIRIFSAANIIIYSILWFASYTPRIARRLFPAALLFLTITLFLSYMYLFETNWISTIAHRSYLGWGFLWGVIILTLWTGGELIVDSLFSINDDANSSDTPKL